MPRAVRPAEAVEEARRCHAAHPDETLFIGVDGYGGAGKSTLAASIADAVPGAVVVHIDDFAGPHVPEWDWPHFGEQVTAPLLAGRPARYQRWEWNKDEPAEWHDVPVGRVVVVEGVSCTRRELTVPWALQIWVDAPRVVRLERARQRDGEAMMTHWTEVWMPAEDAYVERERPQERVDLLVDGTAGSENLGQWVQS
jgi:uridine kinase